MSRTLTIEDYEITRDGKVINKHSGHALIGQPNGKGYLRVSIGGKLMFIHRLVAEKYIPNPEEKEQVNHKDGNKLNNNVDNLEWVTNQENRNHAIKNGLHFSGEKCPWTKLSQKDVEEIRSLEGIKTIQQLAEMYEVSESNIRAIQQYKSWKNS